MTESADVFAPEIVENALIQNALNIIEHQSAEMAQAMIPIAIAGMMGAEAPAALHRNFIDIATRAMAINKEVVQEIKKLIPTAPELKTDNELFHTRMHELLEKHEIGQRLILIQQEGPREKADRLEKENHISARHGDLFNEFKKRGF